MALEQLGTSIVEGRLAVHVKYREKGLNMLLRDAIDERAEFCFTKLCWTFPLEAKPLRRVVNTFMLDPLTLPIEAQQIMAGEKDPFARESPSPEMLAYAREAWSLGLPDHPPLEHQPLGLAWLLQEAKFLLAWDMGLGKTLIGIARIMRMLRENELDGRKVLILCPQPMLDVWEQSFRIFANQPVFVYDKKTSKKVCSVERERKIWVSNYDMIWRNVDELRNLRFGAVLADEVHRLKDSTTKTTKAAQTIAMYSRYRWGFSGTPFPNGPLDVHGVFSWIDPGVLGAMGKTIFKTQYCVISEHVPGKVIAIRSADDLARRIGSRSSFVRKEEVLHHLPPKVFVTQKCDLSADQARIYKEIREDCLAKLSELEDKGELTVANVLSQSLRLLQVVGGFLPNDDGEIQRIGSPKYDLLMDLIEELGTQPAVIWTAFKPEAEEIGRLLGDQACVHIGEYADKAKKEAKNGFLEGRYRWLVSTSASLREGVTLVKSGRRPVANAIYFSRNHALLNWLQSRDRIHRIGQEEQVTIYKLMMRNTVDIKVDNCLEGKVSMQNTLLSQGVEAFL